MAIRTIREIGDEILNKRCKEIKKVNNKLMVLIDDMLETMYNSQGVGLAAPQVGILKRLVVIDISEEGDDPIVIINPEIISTDGSQTGEEGCLSVPDKIGTVTRPNYVKIKAYDTNMEEFILEGEGLLARAICHEIDHLNGELFVDKIDGELRDINDDYIEELIEENLKE